MFYMLVSTDGKLEYSWRSEYSAILSKRSLKVALVIV